MRAAVSRMSSTQTVMKVGQNFIKRKLCRICFLQSLIFLMTFLCLFVILIVNIRTTYLDPAQLTNSPLNRLFLSFIERKTLCPPEPPEYKSPGPFFVEYPYKYNFIINEEKRCQELKPYLVLIVPLAPQNKADRQIIRQTWGAQKVVLGKNVTLFFLLGLGKADEKELLEESKEYGDMIQADFIDCYKNLTIKTMVMLEWLDSHCRDATYAMKIDTDMFLNLPKLMGMLENAPTTKYLTGLVERAAVVHRHTSSKWFVPFDVYWAKTYPPYALGQGYILSLDLAKKLHDVASREKIAFYLEDVYLGMCMQRLGLALTNPPDYGAFPLFGPKFDRCRYSKIITTRYPDGSDKLQLFRKFMEPGAHCENKKG